MSIFTSQGDIKIMHRLLTSLVRYLAHIRMRLLSQTIIRLYCYIYNISLSECVFKKPSEYTSLANFFIRKLDMNYRPMGYGNWVSPADGKVILNQPLESDTTICAKGTGFSPNTLTQTFEKLNGYHATTIYLAPKDYHRVHMPTTATLVDIKEVGGLLKSVAPNQITKNPMLFSDNKRVILTFHSKEGVFYLVLVGALIVGEIVLVNDEGPLHLNQEYQKGEQLGYFTFGSTVIMITPMALSVQLGPVKVRAQISDQT